LIYGRRGHDADDVGHDDREPSQEDGERKRLPTCAWGVGCGVWGVGCGFGDRHVGTSTRTGIESKKTAAGRDNGEIAGAGV